MTDPKAKESPIHERIKTIRSLFQVFGAIVCALFVLQGVVIFTNTAEVTNFWQACHWISEGLLCIVTGLIGFLLEIRALFSSVRQHLHNFVVNRIGLALVYLWIGCYSMGGFIEVSAEWSLVGKVTGITAWVVGAVDILMSCCSDRYERPPDKKDPEAPEAVGNNGGKKAPPQPGAVMPGDEATTIGTPADPEQPSTAPREDGGANPFGAGEEPEGGWATVGTFGSK
mmetsp:Transcript_83785/g.194920  ORF Transcript_83785/g.194920 Transcript_83785/m.194920 type:complete len:227 (+) Transcript_83785:70-750(+)|eukprot:CAMPEP_0171110734 /NCGR_PEP_ID=MMETSP0766_2-20121228/72382_1 /TAXON_ID=439317 /ORGANISM="Gambierdiscus australes, Strain CAWD 149" /LENGTH=226 /DNA_ID=CAMNT_0011572645 /DNA_START=19 /DNA_END=699 /DNA_ORIENTATION=-